MEYNYLNLLVKILQSGQKVNDRTGVGTTSLFGESLQFDLQKGFPLLTTKKMHAPSIVHELLWFLRGDTNIEYLKQNKVRIWDEWASPEGELGPVYGAQWRGWPTFSESGEPVGKVDQIANLINGILTNPTSRRHIVSAWNVGQLRDMALPPCHLLFQVYVRGEFLDLQMYQRSADAFLGVPFNIASYALLLTMLATVTGYTPGTLNIVFGDIHIYDNHREQVRVQVGRVPYTFPKLQLNPKETIFDFVAEDIRVVDYVHHGVLTGKVAV